LGTVYRYRGTKTQEVSTPSNNQVARGVQGPIPRAHRAATSKEFRPQDPVDRGSSTN